MLKLRGERCCNLNWRTPLNCSLRMFIGMKHIWPTFTIIRMYLRLPTFTKTLPQMSFHLSTHNSADCWNAHRSPAARDCFKRVHDWCKAGWRRPGAHPPPPPTKILVTPVPLMQAGRPQQKSWLHRLHHTYAQRVTWRYTWDLVLLLTVQGNIGKYATLLLKIVKKTKTRWFGYVERAKGTLANIILQV